MKLPVNRKGMTLVEVMVTIGILSMAGVALVSLLAQSLTGYSSCTSRDTATSQVTLALQKLGNEIRDGRMADISTDTLTVHFPVQLQDPATGERMYDLSTNDPIPRVYCIEGEDLVRSVDGEVTVVATGITSAEFSGNEGRVNITLTREAVGKYDQKEPETVTARVALRNFQD